MPPALQNTRVLASTAIFFAAILRNFWHWTGVRPVSKPAMQHLLRTSRASCVLCPGGVRECFYMQPLRIEWGGGKERGGGTAKHCGGAVRLYGQEVAYLTKRTGFVRMALEEGVDLVCVR